MGAHLCIYSMSLILGIIFSHSWLKGFTFILYLHVDTLFIWQQIIYQIIAAVFGFCFIYFLSTFLRDTLELIKLCLTSGLRLK